MVSHGQLDEQGSWLGRDAGKGSPACLMDDCRFCGLNRGQRDLFWDLHGESPHLDVPGIPDSMMVMLCAFPIGYAGGHLLIAPAQHDSSLAKLGCGDDLRTTVRVVTPLLQRMFPAHWLLAFEHGSGSIAQTPVKCGGCHVDHAHGHILVLDSNVDFEEIRHLTEAALEQLGWDMPRQMGVSVQPFHDIEKFTGEHPYLHIGMLAPRPVAFTYRQLSHSQSIPSQLLRKIVGMAAGKPQPSYWNWKIAIEHNMQDRLRRYGDAAREFKLILNQFLTTGTVRT